MNKELIDEIIENRIRESDILEYKAYIFDNGKFSSLTQNEINNFIKEICSFANYDGGKIIIGIGEDEHHNPTNIIDTGVDETSFETWEQSFRNKIATTTIPAIYNINLELIRYSDEATCIVIEIPRSILKPHAFNTGTKDEFYIRNGNTSNPMRYNDIKNSFNALEFTQERISRFVNDRLSFILDGTLDESMISDSSLVLHIVPEWSLDLTNFLHLQKIKYNNELVCINPGRKGRISFNADGFIDIYGHSDRKVMSYIQVFKNACIEATEIRLLNDYKDKTIYKWYELEETLVKRIYQYINELKELEIYGGYYVTVSLLNIKGKKAEYNDWGECSEDIIYNIVKTPIIKWDSSMSFSEAICPILTSLAYTFGLDKSYFYKDDLTPQESKFEFIKEYK